MMLFNQTIQIRLPSAILDLCDKSKNDVRLSSTGIESKENEIYENDLKRYRLSAVSSRENKRYRGLKCINLSADRVNN